VSLSIQHWLSAWLLPVLLLLLLVLVVVVLLLLLLLLWAPVQAAHPSKACKLSPSVCADTGSSVHMLSGKHQRHTT
jgi:hypothetical protein